MNFISPDSETRRKLFHWAAMQPFCVLLDSCGTQIDRYGHYEWILAVSVSKETLSITTVDALKSAVDGKTWLFGAFSYEARNMFEPRMHTSCPAFVPVPDVVFFEPEFVVAQLRGQSGVQVLKGTAEKLSELVGDFVPSHAHPSPTFQFRSNFDQEAYVRAVSRVRDHIREGDTYELNLSQCYRAEGQMKHPFSVWEAMKAVSPTPFAGFGKWNSVHLLCASPERFLQLQEGTLRTQPIKGTAPRHNEPSLDRQSAEILQGSEKERAENVMIVDLSRNDLNRVCKAGSVIVPHLFEVQTFKQVHHLVSTVEGEIRGEADAFSAFATVFPPGSMTGAPKIRTCELIDEIEGEGRGLYSGAMGYFNPDGNFDFNVVIRSVVYDSDTSKLSYHVGGAITWDSDPEAEYAETLLKATGILQVLGK